MKARIVDITLKSNLKRKIRQHLKLLGFIKMEDGSLDLPSFDKKIIRSLHSLYRDEGIRSNSIFINTKLPKLLQYFASGNEIRPDRISPVLQRVFSDTWESD